MRRSRTQSPASLLRKRGRWAAPGRRGSTITLDPLVPYLACHGTARTCRCMARHHGGRVRSCNL
jgi:hypothetical protein